MRRGLTLLLISAVHLYAAIPTITTFTGPSAIYTGQTFQLCWTVGNVPTSITITPGLTGDQTTTYVDSTNPASGCATFTPPLARFSADGDSLTCGFRATGAAQNAPASGTLNLPCSPNPSPNGAPNTAWPVRARAGLEQRGYSISSYVNLAIVGITASGHTPTTCSGTTFNPDILAVTFGANDMQGITTNGQADTVYANLKTLWAAAKATPCKVVVWTLTPRTSGPNPDSVRVYLNGLITGTPALYDAVIDIGNTSDPMGCAGCNTTATTLFNADGTHYLDAGYAHAGDLAAAAMASLMRSTYTITATNGSGTSAATTLVIPLKRNVPAAVFGSITR